ncbi:growth arrest-specific protein 8-like [Stegastes partitus]|uniref:Dynein regulatory complex subunit 4 n=1 Tax=Stegastes partitus TaxID=144197 RepID=A0A9Y4N8D5_9TELE|nr:PREDICTED: growth arrest-specific protein 8-like [Stegastes partitus]
MFFAQVYKQKMKHLLCEHQNTISELKAGVLVSTEMMQTEQEQLETELWRKRKAIMVDMQELDNDSLVRELELKHDEEMTTTRNKWEEQYTEITAKHEEKMLLVRQELEEMRKTAVRKTEQKWDNHVTALKEDQNQFFNAATPIVDQVHRDTNKLFEVKGEMSSLMRTWKLMEKDLELILLDNTRLAKLISKLEEENTKMEKKVKFYLPKKDPSHPNEKIRKKELENLRWEHEVLGEKFTKLQLERDELHKTFPQRIQKLQHKADQATVLMEEKLQALTDSVENMEAQLSSVLSASNVDQTALSGIINKVEETLMSRNTAIKDLQHKKNLKAHRDLLLTTEAKQKPLCVPVEVLRVNP